MRSRPAGRTELALSLFGITKPDEGKIYLNGAPVKFRSHTDALKSGIGYISEDRLTLGLILEQSVEDNTILSVITEMKNTIGLIDNDLVKSTVEKWIESLDVKSNNIHDPISTLSGGNQQKIVLAKWMLTNPKVLILDSPTVGVDVGAKDSIYKLIRNLADQGVAIVFISDEIPEIYYNSDEILHFDKGRVINHFKPKDMSIENLLEAVDGI
ncbi:ATP-binding cassette domain-containing protein [Vibrio sp. S12_S33]|uniref:ATP-binding cassette domain-containing protein n=1 Tax=Vibrio sp. S12_S33 TaxID=2720223 RepID=UPI00192DD78B